MIRRNALIALLLLGISASIYIAAQRYRVENLNKAVEIVLDYDEITQLAAASGKNPADVLSEFKKAGATSVAISEQTAGDLLADMNVPAGNTYREPQNLLSAERHLAMILPKYPNSVFILQPWLNSYQKQSDIPSNYLKQLPVGLSTLEVRTVQSAKINVIARLINYPGANPSAVNAILKDVKSQGVNTIIFSGDSVLGFKGAVKETAKSLLDNKLNFGRVEFSKQKGEAELAERAIQNVITVHSITQAEMPTLDENSIIDRFAKGVKERGVRMIYVRMYYSASPDIVSDNAEYIGKIAKEIKKAGYTLRKSHPSAEVEVPRVLRAIAGIGVAAGALLLLISIVDLTATGTLIWSILAILGCGGLAFMGDTGQKIVALLSAIVFPTLAAITLTRNTPKAPTHVAHPITQAIGRLIGAVAISAAGGMLIVGLLSERSFMLRVDQFMGVKLAHLLPVVILAILYAGNIAWRSGKLAEQKSKLIHTFKNMAANPILIWQAAGMIAVLAVIGLMVARSGNDSGVGVSDFELKFRAILDKIMYVRPRTKEFLIGYPALILGIAFALRGRRAWAAPLIVVGSIGLVSALNTFCHIHTPILISVWRVINGTIVGIILGVIAYKFLHGLPGREK